MAVGKPVDAIQWFAEKCVGIQRREEKEEEGEEQPYETEGYPVIHSECGFCIIYASWLGDHPKHFIMRKDFCTKFGWAVTWTLYG